jgi:hypothetical protein
VAPALPSGTHSQDHALPNSPHFGPRRLVPLQATLLHLLGIDHERFTHRFQGRRYRLTDVFGEVVPGLLG